MKRVLSFACALALVLAVFLSFAPAAKAEALDEILEYRITVDVNTDGTLTMLYHFDWRVLDSDSEGPLSWLLIGIPNSNFVSYKALTDNIRDISYSSNGGSYLRLDLDRDYYEGEELSFEFELVQDYMYEMNRMAEGETYYEFTPGWFDARVDKLVIKWNSENVKSVSPACLLREDGYYTWETSLGSNETYTVSVVYPNESYSFDATKTIGGEDNGGGWYDPGYSGSTDACSGCNGSVAVSGFVFFALIVGVISAIKRGFQSVFNSTAGFGGASATKKITREKIEYYDSCPSCGAPRQEGRDDCQYCGKSLIKSRETVTEEQVPEEVKDKTTSGTYHYGPNPNTFLRVHVVNVPAPRVSASHSSSSSRSSCAHSSCACASHCACACACACAGGGRAGCTTKDFYNTGLKLEMLEKQAKKK
jgi:hypothetical protein